MIGAKLRNDPALTHNFKLCAAPNRCAGRLEHSTVRRFPGGVWMAGRNSDSAGYTSRVSCERRIGINANELARLAALDTGALPMDGIGQLAPVRSDDRTVLPQYVKRAVAYMHGNLAERITLAELASACGLSQRTLLKQFQRFVGLPPLAYLRRLRLNAARQELVNGASEVSVSELATRCGYAHLGRFAGDYRRLFGEAPSATRQRVRAPVANGAAAGKPATVAGRERPTLLILPLRTETLRESLEARDLTERLGATLSRMRIASVTLPHPSRCLAMNAPQPRNAGTRVPPAGPADTARRAHARRCQAGRCRHRSARLGRQFRWFGQ